MAVRLRLRRTGSRNKACYRIVAADSRSPRDGRFIEILGYYNPRHEDEKINLERAQYWISNGARPSRTVAGVIKRAHESPKESVSGPESKEPAEIISEPVVVPNEVDEITRTESEPSEEDATVEDATSEPGSESESVLSDENKTQDQTTEEQGEIPGTSELKTVLSEESESTEDTNEDRLDTEKDEGRIPDEESSSEKSSTT